MDEASSRTQEPNENRLADENLTEDLKWEQSSAGQESEQQKPE
jgi:hypothetical protein